MKRYLGQEGEFGNPASLSHRFGQEAARAIELAREQVARLLNAAPNEVVWTSGATEAINLALKGVAYAASDKGRTRNGHIVTSVLEHKAVLDTCAQLAHEGLEVTYITPNEDGLITPEQVDDALRDDTILVSLMFVNNETGTVTDVDKIGELTRARAIPFHIDAVQAAARLPIDARTVNADLISISAHKIYGPKGIGALYIRRRSGLALEPQIHGGDQERGVRPGTLATHQVVGMGKAAELIGERRDKDREQIRVLDRRMLDQICDIDQVSLNGNQAYRAPGIINVCFHHVESESLMMALKDVAISSGSACTSARIEPSHVLLGLGLPDHVARCSVRISIGRFTTAPEIDRAAGRIREAVGMLRELSAYSGQHVTVAAQ